MSQLKFICPNCGDNKIEEIMTDAVVTSDINNIHESGDIDYGESSHEGGFINHFQCRGCGEIVGKDSSQTRGVVTPEDLYNYLKEKGMIKDMPTKKRSPTC